MRGREPGAAYVDTEDLGNGRLRYGLNMPVM